MDLGSGGSSFNATALLMSRPRSGGDPEASAEQIRLLDRAISGDFAAFDEIVVRHERRVLTLAWRLLGAVEDAQDAAQEVFLRAFKYLHRFDTRKPFEPWLIRMTVNVCRDIGRKRQQQRTMFIHDEADHRDPRNDPHSDLDAEQQRQMLYSALDRLGGKERMALVLRDIEGFTTAEVAELLGSSEVTVRSQISMARLKLRKLMSRGERR